MEKIETKEQYIIAIDHFEEIFQAKAGTKESDEADVFALLIKDYEERHSIIEVCDPIATNKKAKGKLDSPIYLLPF